MKRLLDLLGAFAGLVVLSPVLVVAAIAVKLTDGGRVLYSQERIGRDGRVFRMYKFRTMVENAEEMGTGLFSYNDDPRITPVGRILRRMSIDELPQLFNVLQGSMSLVGPRPPVVYELGEYSSFAPRLKSRFVVNPGITGLAQVTGRNDLDWDEKVEEDLKYIEKYSRFGIAYDLYLIARTIYVVLSMRSVVEPRR